jgi:hypothetical protein
MKIGTSLGRCVKDILDGHIRYEDVLFIVTNTNCPTLKTLMEVIEEYYYAYRGSLGKGGAYDLSAHSLESAKMIAQRLFENGKLHQPRANSKYVFGNAHSLEDTWYDIVPSPVMDNESVREAWNHYVMIRNLAS